MQASVKMAAKFDFSISENNGYVDSFEKVERIIRDHELIRPRSMLYSKLRRILVEKVRQYKVYLDTADLYMQKFKLTELCS